MPTSKARCGIASIINFKEQPLGIAGVTPIILSFFSASSIMVCPKTSWYFGACFTAKTFLAISPVTLSNKPGACHLVWSFSASSKPLPFIVLMCNNLGPGISFKSCKVSINFATLCPSIGPKYRSFKASNKLLLLLTIPFKPSVSLAAMLRVNVLPTGNLPSKFQTSSLTLL